MNELYWWQRPGQPIRAAYIPGTEDLAQGHSTEATERAWVKEVNRRGIQPDNPLRSFQDCACRALPPNQRAHACAYIDDSAPEQIRRPRVLQFSDVKSFFAKVRDWWRSEEIVTQEEAERRAGICRMCEHNQPASMPGCAACTGKFMELAADIFSFVGHRSTPHDDHLLNCGICGCNLRVLAWAPLDALQKNHNPAHEYPRWCWQK